MRSLELFSGMGGLAYGLELAGARHGCFIEFNKHACQSLRSNFDKSIVNEIDVRNFNFHTLGQIDIIAGGPPCQPFSMGGKHEGNNDTRDMFPYAASAVSVLRPKAFIFENVKGLLRDSFADYFDYIIKRLSYPTISIRDGELWVNHHERLRRANAGKLHDLQYNVRYRLLNAADYGVPQIRERVVIVGIRSDLDEGFNWNFPHRTHSQFSLEQSMFISNLYWERHRISQKQRKDILSHLETRNRSTEVHHSIFESLDRPWQTVRDAISDLPDPQSDHGIPDHKFQGGARPYPGHTGSDYDWPSKTIKAGGHGVPGGENMLRMLNGHRYYTVLEAKRIQTFPDSYIVNGAWGEAMRQIGNAVPVILANKIGKCVIDYLNATDEKKAV